LTRSRTRPAKEQKRGKNRPHRIDWP
jgi:hypothetical protein